MTNKIPITKYDPTRAKWYFALFKFLELFGVFLFTFGFYGLGSLVYKYFPTMYSFFTMYSGSNYFHLWFAGILTSLLVCFLLCVGISILYMFYKIIKLWIMGNWNLAKRATEDKTAKAKRLKEQELAEKRADRKKYGYCAGDEVEILNDAYRERRDHIGKKGKLVGKIKSSGNSSVSFGNHRHFYLLKEFKVTKKQNLKKENTK